MNRFIVAGLLLQLTAAPLLAQPSADRALDLVTDLVENHGGLDVWSESKAVRMTHISHMPHMSSELNWMVGHEMVEHATMRAYADHPLWNSHIASDGQNAWGVNWIFPNSPKGMATIHYHMVFMPWLALSGNVQLGEVGRDMLPEDDTNYQTVSFRNLDNTGVPAGPTWYLYINPGTGKLGGFSIDFGQARAWHRIDTFHEVDGLLLPTDWVTYAGPQKQIIGYHVVADVDLGYKFDQVRMEKPAGAQEY